MEPLSRIVIPAETLAAARCGERAAQAHAYGALAPAVFRLVSRLVPSHSAEDVFQDCMMNVFENPQCYRGDPPFGGWVRAIAVNQALMHLRAPWHRLRERAVASVENAEPGAGEAPPWRDSTAVCVDLARLLNALEPRARAIVQLRDVEGLTHEEIAAAFGLSASFSKSQLARAYRRLRALAAAPPLATAACRGAQT